MPSLICPFFRVEAIRSAIGLAAQQEQTRKAMNHAAVHQIQQQQAVDLGMPEPPAEAMHELLNKSWLLETTWCTGKLCAWWDYDRDKCSQAVVPAAEER